jgi:hypothetical protein
MHLVAEPEFLVGEEVNTFALLHEQETVKHIHLPYLVVLDHHLEVAIQEYESELPCYLTQQNEAEVRGTLMVMDHTRIVELI